MYYKELLAVIATILSIISYIPYIRDIIKGKTKPHAFSWLVWATLVAIGFFGQIADNAGPGAWVIGSTAILCFIVFLFSLKRGEKNITFLDWLSLVSAGIAILFWVLTKEPLLSVILVTIIDAIGFIPTFRKSYIKPNEETLSTYNLSVVKYILSIIALKNYSILTVLFPASLVLTNGLFVGMLLIRRKQLGT